MTFSLARGGPEHPDLDDAILKADILIEALTWIRQFRGKVTVIKLGGSVMEDPRSMTHLLLDVIFMETVGMRPVLVHGGGARISRAMSDAGLTPRFVEGRRYTDDATLAIVERVLAGEINEGLAREIQQYGGKAQSLNFHTTNVLYGERLKLNGPDGQLLDLGHVGNVTSANGEIINRLCDEGIVPVIPSMCVDAGGQKLNVNADTAATAVAQALKAEKMVYLSDVNGVRLDKSDPGSIINSLTADQARDLISSGAIGAGMIPKVQACLDILDSGVRKIHIIDGRVRHALLLEVFTSKGVGTEIMKNGSM
jgi:acetylglutamate kinase